ncbi:DUF3794 domain-containing protein [Aneurinibacillus sp. Ricciae_BoGa-3]|uniref:CsxC family protein n=1 Tax=Aneurinibacillus sp. Ricciae_BoGa-3 TaxID=3022697 RepID=UPI0023420B1F|nr:DUF3794 domain-containing protein [Aneurinibacillus sp. Ricciae_BoGa-3]WCK56187.1 DUF3794 domain-containing protein [Aneurinibacillus sp. Ricciae_BoGa-3]
MSSTPFNPASTTQPECKSTPVEPTHVKSDVIIKVPVVLAELDVQIDMHARIDFPMGQNVLEIKKIKKRVKVTQCRLLLPTNKLFIAGFVRKNIQYAANPMVELPPTPSTMTTELLSTINSLTVDVPFECVTPIHKFLAKPLMPKFNKRKEFDFLVSKPLSGGIGFPEKDELMSTDLSQFHQESSEFFNEMVFCELVSADITEWDESLNRMPITGTTGITRIEEGTFTQLSEKMILELTLKVLQNQQVRVPGNFFECEEE